MSGLECFVVTLAGAQVRVHITFLGLCKEGGRVVWVVFRVRDVVQLCHVGRAAVPAVGRSSVARNVRGARVGRDSCQIPIINKVVFNPFLSWIQDLFCTQHLRVLGAKHISKHDCGRLKQTFAFGKTSTAR